MFLRESIAANSREGKFQFRLRQNKTKSPKFRGWPKLVPTLQDRQALWAILSERFDQVPWDFSADPSDNREREGSELMAQWKCIRTYLKADLFDKHGEFVRLQLDELLRKVQEGLRFISITLDEDDDPNEIFTKLNAKGIPLRLQDLVRNEVFSKFAPDESARADKFYEKSWHPFELSFPTATIDGFFPVYSFIAFQGSVTKAAAFPELQGRWKTSTPQAILTHLREYASYYCSLVRYHENPDLPNEINGMAERISRMPRITVTWPFMIQVLQAAATGHLSRGKALACLEIVESFLVRRALLGIEPTGLHSVFKVLWKNTKGEPFKVIEHVLTRTIKCPADDELLDALKNESSDGSKILRYVLEELERHHRKVRKYDPAPVSALTIEHILPQHRTAQWGKLFSENEHSELVGLIGNIVPLSEEQNKSLKDQPWDEKRKRFRGSNWRLAQEVARKQNWTPQRIRARTRSVAEWIIGRWPTLERIAARVK